MNELVEQGAGRDGDAFRVFPDALEQLLEACFRAAGFSPSCTRAVAKHLVDAERMGVASHGIARLPSYLAQVRAGDLDPSAEPRRSADRGGLITVDGHGGIGIPAMELALDLAMARSRELGVAVAAIVNCGHTGRLGAYVQRGASAGFVTFCLGGGGRQKWPNVAPFGAVQGAVSTNPFAAGFPGDPGQDPFSDFATSAISTGKALLCDAKGALLPEGVAMDANGHPTRSPAAFLDGGFLAPFGGAKGSGLGVLAELVGEALLGPAHEFNWLMIVVRGDGFRPLPDVRRDAAAFVDHVRSLRPAAGFDRVLAPGDPERLRARRSDEAGLLIEAGVWKKVSTAALAVGVDPHEALKASIEAPAADA